MVMIFPILTASRECGSLFDVSSGRICHLLSHLPLDHFCKQIPPALHLHPAPDGVPGVIPFTNCDSETDYAVVRVLCKISQRPAIETDDHVVWLANGDTSATDPETPDYLFIFEVNAYELFGFQVDGQVLSCSNHDHHSRRAVICLTLESTLYRYVYSNNRWSESDSFVEFISDRALLTSPSFVLEHCISASVIVGTTGGVQLMEIGNYRDPYELTSLQAVKLLKPKLCGGVLYILTSGGLQLYDVHSLQAQALQPMNWSVAELSLEGRRFALAGIYPADRSCWIQVRKTENQEVMLNVTHEDCNIASIAVSEMYVCYHQTNTSSNSWKLACIGLRGNGEELVLWEGKQSGLKDWSLILGGNVLVERNWGASPYILTFYHLPLRTAAHTYKSRYSTIAYPHMTSGSQGCRINPRIEPTPVVEVPTAEMTSVSSSVSSSVQPTSSAGGMPGDFSAPSTAHIAGYIGVGVLTVVMCPVIISLVGIMLCCMKNRWRGEKYPTNEGKPNTWQPRIANASVTCDV